MFKRIPILIGLACALLTAADYRGTVKSGALAIPGATVTAKSGDRQISTSTDESGNYVFQNMPPGSYVIEVEMMGFASVQAQLEMGDTDPPLHELAIKLGSNPAPVQAASAALIPAAAKPATEGAKPAATVGKTPTQTAAAVPPVAARNRAGGASRAPGGGFQRLEVSGTGQAADINAPDVAGPSQEVAQGANESFLVKQFEQWI